MPTHKPLNLGAPKKTTKRKKAAAAPLTDAPVQSQCARVPCTSYWQPVGSVNVSVSSKDAPKGCTSTDVKSRMMG